MTILSKKKTSNDKRTENDKDSAHASSQRNVRIDSNTRSRNTPVASAVSNAQNPAACWSPTTRLDDTSSLNETSDSGDLSLTLLNANANTNGLTMVNSGGSGAKTHASPATNTVNKRKVRNSSPSATERSVRSRKTTKRNTLVSNTNSTNNINTANMIVVDMSSSDDSSISQNNSEDEYNIDDNTEFREYFKDAEALKEVRKEFFDFNQ
jgi:hypothetical protein